MMEAAEHEDDQAIDWVADEDVYAIDDTPPPTLTTPFGEHDAWFVDDDAELDAASYDDGFEGYLGGDPHQW